jgi:prepilin-type N-terminal cleavage/methylation domain-containing protein
MKAGFTLIEFVLALVLATLVSSALYQSLAQLRMLRKKIELLADNAKALIGIEEILYRDVQGMMVVPLEAQASSSVASEQWRSVAPIWLEKQNDGAWKLSFYTVNPTVPNLAGPLRIVYAFVPPTSSAPGRLERACFALPPTTQQQEEQKALAVYTAVEAVVGAEVMLHMRRCSSAEKQAEKKEGVIESVNSLASKEEAALFEPLPTSITLTLRRGVAGDEQSATWGVAVAVQTECQPTKQARGAEGMR